MKNNSLNKMLSQQAKEIFQLDDKAWQIIQLISENGPLTIYNITKNVNFSRPAIYLRLFGQQERKKKEIGQGKHPSKWGQEQWDEWIRFEEDLEEKLDSIFDRG